MMAAPVAAAEKPVTISITVDENGNITVSPTAVVVKVGQRVDWTFADARAKAMMLVFYEGNPITKPILRAKGKERATDRAANRGIYHYQVVVARAGASVDGRETEIDLFADTGCPTIIVE
jgi:plastocyanin